MKLYICSTIVFLFLFLSCNDDKNKTKNYALLDIESSITIGNTNNFSLNKIVKEINVIPTETNDSTLLKHMFIAGVIGNEIIFYDKEALYSVNRTNGKVNTILRKQGSGPEEYKYIIDVIIDNDSIVYIYDSGKRGFLKFNINGTFNQFIKNDSIGTFQKIKDDYSVVCYSPFINSNNFVSIYDEKGNYYRNSIHNNRKDIELDMYYWNRLNKYNDLILFKDFLGDTIYNITAQADLPYIVLNKGKYKIPIEIASNRDKVDKEGHKYVQQESFYISSHYCFFTYYFDRNKYYDIWDMNTSRLLYRNILIYQSRDIRIGTPVKINNQDINVWANFAINNYIYCIVEAEDAIKLIPSLPEDSNPILLEIKLE